MEAKIRRAGLIIASGLFLQFLTLLPLHPLAFIAFVGIGVPVMAVGVILFLFSLVSDVKPMIQPHSSYHTPPESSALSTNV